MDKISKFKVLLMGLATIIGFPILAWLTVYFFVDENAIAYLLPFDDWKLMHAVWGIIWGTAFGCIGLFLINLPFMKKSTMKYENMIDALNLNLGLIIFLSIAAGVGEELFFRGALQPLLGIWPTSIIFVAIHGYLNPTDWRIFLYGSVLTLFIFSLGYVFELQSILFPIAAHAMYDFVLLFWYLKKVRKKRMPDFE